jgi:hypothetical protein
MPGVAIQVGYLLELLEAGDAEKLLGELDRPRGGAAGGEAQEAARIIRTAQTQGPEGGGVARFDARYGPALLGAIDDAERSAHGLISPELMALQMTLRELVFASWTR